MKAQQPIPKASAKLRALCNADNQFANFERVFANAMAVPKAEILKREAKAKKHSAKPQAKPKRG